MDTSFCTCNSLKFHSLTLRIEIISLELGLPGRLLFWVGCGGIAVGLPGRVVFWVGCGGMAVGLPGRLVFWVGCRGMAVGRLFCIA